MDIDAIIRSNQEVIAQAQKASREYERTLRRIGGGYTTKSPTKRTKRTRKPRKNRV